MYPLISYMPKCLKFKYLLKIANIGKKKTYKKFGISENRRTFAFGNGNKPDTKKLFDNIDSGKAGCDRYCFLGLYAVCPYAT